MMRFAFLFLLLSAPCFGADPPAPAAPPTVADILKADQAIAEAIKKRDELVSDFNKELAKLKIAPIEAIQRIGKQGPPGLSAYEVAKKNGFVGTEVEWLASLRGPPGPQGIPGPPGPGPIPPPPPIVKTGAYVIMIVDETDRGTWQTAVTDGQTAKALRTAQRLYIYGSVSDAAKIQAKAYDQLLRDAQLTAPALIVLDDYGKAVFPTKAIRLPATEANLAAILKEVMKP